MKLRASLLAAAILAALHSRAVGQPAATPPPTRSQPATTPNAREAATETAQASRGTCGTRHASALGQVACELAVELKVGNTPTLVFAVVGSQPGAPRELSQTLARLVAGELGDNARAATQTLTEPTPPRAPHGSSVVLVQARLEADRLAVTADRYDSPRGFWDRFRPGVRGSSAHAHAARGLDAELRGFLPKVPLVVSRIDKASAPDEPPLALGCGDVDGDGSLEIVSVGRRRVQLGRVAGAAFRAFRSLAWSDLSPVAPQPLREPIASLYVASGDGLVVGLTDRADALALDSSLRVRARYPARMPWPGGGCARVLVAGLSSEREACERSTLAAADQLGALDAITGAPVVRRDGTTFRAFARRRKDGKLELELGERRLELPDTVGAQLALGDLDGDGQTELLTSVDTLDPATDALSVRTLSADGKVTPAFRIDVPGGIRALAVCPSEGAALTPVVLATSDALWVLR